MRLVGLRFDVVAKERVWYLVFYDIDKSSITCGELFEVDRIMRDYGISYFLYKTKNGYHIVGLTPLDEMQWGNTFHSLRELFNSYYGGIVIRIWRKQNETQELVQSNLEYGEVIPNLYNIYAERFGLQKRPWKYELAKYLLVFEKYRTEKQ